MTALLEYVTTKWLFYNTNLMEQWAMYMSSSIQFYILIILKFLPINYASII